MGEFLAEVAAKGTAEKRAGEKEGEEKEIEKIPFFDREIKKGEKAQGSCPDDDRAPFEDGGGIDVCLPIIGSHRRAEGFRLVVRGEGEDAAGEAPAHDAAGTVFEDLVRAVDCFLGAILVMAWDHSVGKERLA